MSIPRNLSVHAPNISAGGVLSVAGGGTGTTTSTGTGSVVLSANPTFTGTVTTSNITANGSLNLTSLTASSSVATDASKNLISVANTGTGNNVLDTSPTFVNSIGINAAPSALWNTNAANLLQVGSASAIYTYFGNFNFTSNVLWKADGLYYYVADGPATRYSHFDGNHRFYNAVSGLAGGEITFTQPMTLKANGSLNLTSLTASSSVATDASQNLISVDNTGTGNNVLDTGPTISGATFNDGYTEEVFVITGTNPALSPVNGSIQTWALSASQTPTAGTWAAGQSITLMINDSASAYTINWTSLPVSWMGNSAPVLTPASGYTVIQLWKVGTVIYGVLTGQVV